MKLFSPEEIKTTKASELARDIRRTQDIKGALDKVRTELNNTHTEFDSVLASQRVKWITEQEDALKKIGDLTNELKSLQKQREQLLIPIDLEKKRADNIVIEANDLMSKASEKQNEIEVTFEALQERLDEVSEKEQALQDRENNLFAKEAGCKAQEKFAQETSQKVTAQLTSFMSDMEAKEGDFNKRKTELDLKSISIQRKEIDLFNKEQEISKEKELIYSQRMALQAALQLRK